MKAERLDESLETQSARAAVAWWGQRMAVWLGNLLAHDWVEMMAVKLVQSLDYVQVVK